MMKQALKLLLLGLGVLFMNAAGAGEMVTYYHSDLAGSPVSTTDSKGYEIFSADYEPYGYHRLGAVDASNADGNVRWFASHVEDTATGLSYMGARYYEPALGRFMSVDPVGPVVTNLRTFTRYGYANNNPYRYVDPDGGSALSILDWKDFAVDVGSLLVDEIVYGAAVINGNDEVAALAIEGMVEKRMDAAASTFGLMSPTPGSGKVVKAGIKSAEKMAESRRIGKSGEAIIEKEMKDEGEEIAGRQVTLETVNGERSRVDWVTKDGKAVEGKANGAELSKGQKAVKKAIENGEPVTPRGQNAKDAGLEPDKPVEMKEYQVRRCEVHPNKGCGPG